MSRLPTITLRALLLIPLATVMGLLGASSARATTLYVDASCGDDAQAGTSRYCADANGPKLTIQGAINTAVDTDEIVVELGTYNEVIDFLGKAITLRSIDPSAPAAVAATIIDGTGLNNSVVTCASGEGPDTVIDGFTIIGGAGTACFSSKTCGGGMYNDNSSPTVTNCTFTENSAFHGGGIYSWVSSPTVTGCTFIRNHDTAVGGGMYNMYDSSPTVSHCTFTDNTATYGGGGMFNANASNPTVTNCTFTGNTARSGGAMSNGGDSTPTVTDCIFSGNTATEDGGGMYNHSSSPTVTACAFRGNSARGGDGLPLSKGGGMYNYYGSSPAVTNCTFSGNTAQIGGGMGNLVGFPLVTNCTFTGNTATVDGGGMHNDYDSNPTVTNCIFWGDVPDEIYNDVPGQDNATVSYSDIQGGLSAGSIDGDGNIDADPVFVRVPDDGGDGWGDDPDTTEIDEGANDDYGDLRLQSGSQCRNFGDPDFIPEPGETDLDGHARVLCGRVDMGAYEFGIGDYDCNDAVDLLDFSTWEGCMTGPDGGPYAEGCEAFDFDGDIDVDMTDFALFVAGFEGS